MQVQQKMIQSAVAGLMLIGLVGATSVARADEAKEKCFGVAKAGQNDCGSNMSKHSCAGQSKVDNDPADYKFVAAGTCAKMGGTMKPM